MPNEKAPPTPVLGWPNLILKGIAYLLNADAEGKKDTTYLTIKLNLKEIDLAEAFKQFELPLPVSLRGKVSINAQVDIPTDSTGDWKTYRVRGPVSSSRLEVEGLPLEKLSANLNLDKGIVSISDFIGTIPGPEGHLGGSFHVDGNVTLKEGYPFQANVELSRTSLAAIEKLTGPLPLVLQGDLTTTGQLSGKLSPLTVTGSGSAEVKKLLLGILPLDGVQFQWQTDGDRISLKKIDAATGTGKLSGEATIPIRDRAEGSAALKLEGYDLGEISKRFSANAKLKLEGRASGSITAKIPPVAKGGTRSVTAEIDLQAPKLKLQGLPAERIKGTANYAEETLKYQLTGDTLGGKFEVDGQYPSPKPKVKPQLPPKKEDDAPTQGRLKLQNIRLSRILKQLKIPNTLDSLEAELSASFPFEFDEQGFLTGVGDAQIDRLRWKEKEIFTKLTGTVRLTEETLRIENLSANLGEGSLRGGIFFNRKNPDRSRMRLTLSHVPANRLLFFMPDLAKVFDAAIDLTMSGTIGSQINLVGTVAAEHGKINGVPVSELRLPFQFDFAPSSGRAELRIREATGQVARGKVNGKLELDFYSDLPSRVEGEVQFTNVNVQMIADGAEAVTGNNPVTGKFDFNGTNVQSVNDLKGSLRANLGEAKPLLLPLLSDLVPFLGPGSSVSSLIREGEVRASLSNGLFRFQKFSLTGPQLSLFIDGTISLLGRVDLNVVAQAGNFGLDSRLVRLARLALPLTGVGIPVRIAADASRILSNRTVRLEITGTLRNHTTRIKPLALLSDEAIRYFLEQAIGR